VAGDAEHRFGCGVELDDDALIVTRDDRIERAIEDPAKAPLAVAQCRGGLVVRDRDPDQPRRRAQRLDVERLPRAFIDAVVKADRPPPGAASHDRDAHVRFDLTPSIVSHSR
jgi:hypothetical protein